MAKVFLRYRPRRCGIVLGLLAAAFPGAVAHAGCAACQAFAPVFPAWVGYLAPDGETDADSAAAAPDTEVLEPEQIEEPPRRSFVPS